MVDEGFAFGMIFWCVEYLQKKLLKKAQMRRFIKTMIEGKQRATILEAISCQFQLVISVNIGDLKFSGGAHRTLRQPHE